MPTLCSAQVVTYQGMAGLYIGSPGEVWQAAAKLSARVHIGYVGRPPRRVLSIMLEVNIPTGWQQLQFPAHGT